MIRVLVVAASLTLTLGAIPALAQPAAAPAQTPAPAAPPAPVPPAPFPQGARVAFVNLQAIAAQSADGKVAQGKVAALTQKKQAEIAEKTKLVQSQQQKLQTGAGVLSDAARLQLERDIERSNVELERLQQDAQAEVNQLQQELQVEFEKKLFPILQQISKEKDLHLLFSAADAGLIWAADGLDLTAEAIRQLDRLSNPPATPQP